MILICDIITFKKKEPSFMRVRPSDRDILSFLYSQYHQIYCIFQCIMCTESLCASSPLCDIQLVWQYMCMALTVKHNYFIS